jgi:hypothetical protein
MTHNPLFLIALLALCLLVLAYAVWRMMPRR